MERQSRVEKGEGRVQGALRHSDQEHRCRRGTVPGLCGSETLNNFPSQKVVRDRRLS